LSWSVAIVCSSRPSLPSASQHQASVVMPRSAAVSATRRAVSWSFSRLIRRVTKPAAMPWATSARDHSRMSAAAVTRSP